MTHPNQSLAELARSVLLRIKGVIAVSVRGVPDGFASPHEFRAQGEIAATNADVPVSERQAFIDKYVADKHNELAAELKAGESPFPHVTQGAPELVHYLDGITDLLGPGYDEHVDATIGETRFLAETWDRLIVSVALRTRDPGAKSLPRALRRARKKVES